MRNRCATVELCGKVWFSGVLGRDPDRVLRTLERDPGTTKQPRRNCHVEKGQPYGLLSIEHRRQLGFSFSSRHRGC